MALLSTVKVLEKAVIRRARKLPTPGDVLVSQGDVVAPDTIIAKAEFVKGNPYVVDLRAEFKEKVDPEFVDSVLVKKQGDVVKAGETIARHQKGFWSYVKQVSSPCDGFIEYISRTQGRVIIREDPRTSKPLSIVAAASRLQINPRFLRMFTTVREGDYVSEGKVIASTDGLDFVYAPISGIVEKICTLTGTIVIVKPIKHSKVLAHASGKVSEIIPHYGAVIESVGAYIQGVFGIGGECFGELVVMSDGPNGTLNIDEIDENVKGKVLVSGSFASFEAIQKSKDEGAVGLITGGMNQIDLVRILGKELNIGLTGQEDSDFTVVILEGFGKIVMNDEAWTVLQNGAGSVVSVDGTTQIRAGVLRPEVIVNHSGDAEHDSSLLPLISSDVSEAPSAMHAALKIGDRVRTTRPPYFGLWGTVHRLPEESEKIECEAIVEVAHVELDDGTQIVVPQANLEVFQRER